MDSVDTLDREKIREISEKNKYYELLLNYLRITFSIYNINIKNLHNIIFSSPSKSKIRVLQSIGRGKLKIK